MEAPPPTVQVAAPPSIACTSCNIPLSLVGAHHLRDGKDNALGLLGGMFNDCERLDVYVCPRCGRVDFFVEGLSRQFRQDAGQEGAQGVPASAAAGSRSAVGLLFQEAWRLDQQEQWEVAIPRYEEVLRRYPGTNFARDAERRISQIKLKLGM